MYESIFETAKTTFLGTFTIAFVVFLVRMAILLIKKAKEPKAPPAKNLSEEDLRTSLIEEGKKARENLERNKYSH